MPRVVPDKALLLVSGTILVNQEDILYGVVGDCDNQEYHYGVPFHQISLYRSYYYQPKDPFNSCKNWTIKYNKYDSITNLNVM